MGNFREVGKEKIPDTVSTGIDFTKAACNRADERLNLDSTKSYLKGGMDDNQAESSRRKKAKYLIKHLL